MRTLFLTLITCLFVVPAYAKYSGGAGEPNDPYQIATAADLIALGEDPNDYDKHFILTADIDLDPNLPGRKVFDKAVIAPDINETNERRRFDGTPFTGVFDGNGHTISHLTIIGKDYLGLFGELASEADVIDLGVVDVNIAGSHDLVGGLVGYNSTGDVTHCYSTGVVCGSRDVGGLVGASSHVVGWGRSPAPQQGYIAESYSTASVSGRSNVGGLVGNNGMIDGWYAGNSVVQCYSTGSVNGTERVGGLVGYNSPGGTIITSYSTGSVNGTERVGGLVGDNFYGGTITTSYSGGSVSGDSSVGGLVGSGFHTSVTHSVWDMETSGLSASAGGVGLTSVEMMDPYVLGLNGFGGDPNWVLDPGHDYPKLAWEGTPGGTIPEPNIDWLEGQGTPEEPYRIDIADQLILLGKASVLWDKHFVLTTDIDLDPNLPNRQVFRQAPIPVFGGVFDGNGHTISNLTITGGSDLGLFGQLASVAEVKDLWVVDVNITSSGYCVGGLVGNNGGSITTSYSTGSVTGGGYVGGLVGLNGGSITTSYSASAVSGGDRVGGLVGGNEYAEVTHCYSTGAVTGGGYVGGLVGHNGGSISTSYSASAVSGGDRVGGLVGGNNRPLGVGCFWDIQTSGQSGSAGGIGCTTAEMMDPYMFALNGWANDPNWILDVGRDYPRLAWEGTPGQIIPEPVIDWLDGQGTEQEPYRIDTADQLILLGRASVLWDKHFVLRADIDLDPNLPRRKVFHQAVIAPFEAGALFTGVFDGGGHIISNLTIDGGEILGLFGRLTQEAEVRNIGVVDANIIGSGACAAGLVGENGGRILASYSSGSVSGHWRVGGLVGLNWGSVISSYSSGPVSGTSSDVGGLVGHNSGSITASHSTGAVSGSGGYVGGLVGYSGGSVISSYAAGSVNGNEDVGGLVGRNSGEVTNCYSTGAVRGDSNVGGLVGHNGFSRVTRCYSTGAVNGSSNVGGLVGHTYGGVTQCYSTGAVNGSSNVGGLVGHTYGGVTQCYSTGAVSGNMYVGGLVGLNNHGDVSRCYSSGSVSGHWRVGGLVGYNWEGWIENCFWDTQTSGQASSRGGTGKTTVEMQTASTFLNAGWDFVGETANGVEDVWWILEGKDYPRLWWEAAEQ